MTQALHQLQPLQVGVTLPLLLQLPPQVASTLSATAVLLSLTVMAYADVVHANFQHLFCLLQQHYIRAKHDYTQHCLLTMTSTQYVDYWYPVCHQVAGLLTDLLLQLVLQVAMMATLVTQVP